MDLFRPNQTASNVHSGDVPSASISSEEPITQSNNVLFREIHKNAWLRKLPTLERRSGAVPKKGERVWTVFCVHDDVLPFLEIYIDQKMAAAHKPDWCVSLNSTLHVSPTIVAHDQEYEFVITLPSEVVRLTAPSWETMMEWVDTIRSKLRELRVLCPRENVYSRLPEPRLPLLPTRDPNSPLPLPPSGPSALVPGMEPVRLEAADQVIFPDGNTATTNPNSTEEASRGVGTSSPPTPVHNSRQRIRSSSLSESRTTDPSLSFLSQSPGPTNSASRSPGSVNSALPSRNPSRSRPPASPLPSRTLSTLSSGSRSPVPIEVSNTQTSRAVRVNGASPTTFQDLAPGRNGLGNQNVTVIEVADDRRTPCDIFNFNFVRDTLSSLEPPEEPLEQFFTPPATPRSRASIAHTPNNSDLVLGASPPSSRIWQQISQVVSNLMGSSANTAVAQPQNEVIRVAQGVTNITIPSHDTNADFHSNSSVYEHVYPTASSEPSATEEGRSRPPQQTTNQLRPSAAESQQRRRRTSSGSEALSPRSRGNSQRQDSDRRLHPAPHSIRQATVGIEVVGGGSPRVTLRDQQVLQLRKEMLHPGGVRLQVRRKDCTNSIAFIDAFGAVWIAGWKQREHPMLYNALHIGDQLLSAAGLSVQSAADAQRFIRASTSLYVPFVIRRVPFGRVFAFRRDTEGQSLGITLESGTAEIRDVAPHSPAARGGLASRAPSCDGLSLTPWVITEINGRPLNLFFKDGEVRDRLNAVGKEISVLVQPFDLIKQIKKQLKTLRSYKDYIVQ